ncbi:MAG TPA: sigma-70 family RNA polymerase sigma factor [Segeticoccus sp.]|uniref:sigma-70 family RNA polymerase sigma factor n=1 Tax=Segeticoccus sp. TaxID=2706531 RepID=UPI002D802598|nr:sigma-70 family RNA polymerase sigma factor [Segeticoccus sp.]HET8599119.1 sigma-70 family RNA polymerase sigma factor [Segeticoccus sp.]
MPLLDRTRTAERASTSAESVECLLERARSARDPEREDLLARVVEDRLPLARKLAARYRDRGEPLEDLVQVASMALVMTVRRYQPGRGRSFEAYATPTICGELRRYFREQGWSIRPPRSAQELRPQIVAATEALSQELRRAPTAADIAERLQVSVDAVRRTQLACRSYDLVSLDGPVWGGGDDGPALGDLMDGWDAGFEAAVERTSAGALLSLVSERER